MKAIGKWHREEAFKSSGLIVGGSHKVPHAALEKAEDLLSPEACMKAFEAAKLAKGTRPCWADTDPDNDEPTCPARFKPQGVQAEKPRTREQSHGKSPIDREAVGSLIN